MTIAISNDLHGHALFTHYMRQWIKCRRNSQYFSVYMLSIGWPQLHIDELILTLLDNQFINN